MGSEVRSESGSLAGRIPARIIRPAVSVLDDDTVRGEFLQAWQESQRSSATAHEEGGFVLRADDGSLEAERWPVGTRNEILVPPHPGGRRATGQSRRRSTRRRTRDRTFNRSR